MADQVLPINNLDEVGVILDTPAVALPPNGFSNARNVRFKDGSVRKMKGEVNIFPNIFDDDDNLINGIAANFDGSIIKYFIWWPNPNLSVFNKGYYVVITEEERLQSDNSVPPNGNTDPTHPRDVAYLVDVSGINKVEKGTFDPVGIGQWQHTFFQGGFCLIINNGLNVPNYILDTEDNTTIADVPNFAKLPGWESYLVNQILLQDTFEAGIDSYVFDLGQKVNFTLSSIKVVKQHGIGGTYETLAAAGDTGGASDPNNVNFVAPDWTTYNSLTDGALDSGYITNDEFKIFFDSTTNSHIIFLPNNLSDSASHDDIITVSIKSRDPVFVACGVIRSFGDFLVAGNLVERSEEDLDSPILRSLNGVVRTSDAAAPGSVPNNWDPFASGVSTADEFVLADSGVIKEMVEMQGNLYIYSNNSISVMRLTGNAQVPLSVSPVTRSHGAQTTHAALEYDGKHFVVGSQDIYLFSGHPASIESVGNNRVRKYFFDNLNPLHNQHMFCLRYSQKDEIWICYPDLQSNIGECNKALIWNYKRNTWTIRDLHGVVSGVIGPYPGGGLPQTDITFSGTSGNFGVVNVGAYEVRTIGLDSTDYISTDIYFYASDTSSNLIYGTGRNGDTTRIPVNNYRPFYEEKVLPIYNITGPEDIDFNYTIQIPTGATEYANLSATNIIDQIASQIANQTGWTDTDLPTDYVQFTNNYRLLATIDEENKLGKRAVDATTPFAITRISEGNTLNGDNPNLDFQESTNVASVHGLTKANTNDYRGIYLERSTPTYIGILLTSSSDPSGEEFVLVKAGRTGDYNSEDHTGTDNGVSLSNEESAEKVIARLRNISPALNVIDTGTDGEFSLQPADYADVADFIKEIKINVNKDNSDWIWEQYEKAQAGTIGYNTNSDPINIVYSDGSDPDYPIGEAYLPVHSTAPVIAGGNDHQLDPDVTRVPNRTTTFGTAPTLTYTQVDQEIFDKERPWDTEEINPNLEVPLFACRKNVLDSDENEYILNKITAADVGWSIPTYSYTPRQTALNTTTYRLDITNNDAPLPYESYFERKQLGITPELDTETIRKIVLWADGKYLPYVNSPANYNRLQVRMAGTDNPGQDINLSTLIDSRINSNTFFISEDYRVDLRTHGRFVNYRITDKVLNNNNQEIDEETNPDSNASVAYNKKSDWLVSGIQAEIKKGGNR